MPESYESALMPVGLTSDEYRLLTEECTAVEEKYKKAIRAHEVWKAAKAKEAWLEKLRVDKETPAEKLKDLQKKEEEQKAAEEKKKKEERQAAILKEKQEAMEKQKELDKLKAKEEQKKVEKATKAMESGKGAVEAMEAALVHEERGTDADTKGEMSEGAKKKTLKKLKEICDGKQRVMVPVRPKRKWAPKSTSVVEESDGESRPGPSKRVKTEVSGSMEGEEELVGNTSEKSIRGRMCLCCKTKKATCSFNKGTSSALAVGSKEILELLEKLAHMVETLSNKVDVLAGQAISLGGHVDNLVNNFQSEEIDSLEELISDMEEWQALCVELKDLGSVNSEALWRVMGWWLDEDMVQLRAKGPAEPEKMNTDNPYEVANCEFWYGLRGPNKMVEMKLKCDLFQATQNEFYKLKGHWSKWQFWKAYLQKHNCDDFLVEDSDPGEKVLDGKVRKSQKPYSRDLGIPALDGLFVLDGDSAGTTTSEDEKSDESEDLESAEDDKDALAGGTEDVEMGEVAGVVDA
ncbi:hypothetical protein EV421DRAFT_1730171 [Armillaria borealis]|uniref:Uncharacterized protein n=1 Tax=Armillaria borealis TaxID=47425 RepID=A0AA39K5X6_9AGAR|nr:hypothetical protein EV421DRAFT_1730171 [Armillaria borealis]